MDSDRIEHLKRQMASVEGAVAATNGRLTSVQVSLVERLSHLTEEAEKVIALERDPLLEDLRQIPRNK